MVARGAEAEVAALFDTMPATDLVTATATVMTTGEAETIIHAVVTVTAMGAAGTITGEGEKNSGDAAQDQVISAGAMTTGAIAMTDTGMVGAGATIGETGAVAAAAGVLGVTATAQAQVQQVQDRAMTTVATGTVIGTAILIGTETGSETGTGSASGSAIATETAALRLMTTGTGLEAQAPPPVVVL